LSTPLLSGRRSCLTAGPTDPSRSTKPCAKTCAGRSAAPRPPPVLRRRSALRENASRPPRRKGARAATPDCFLIIQAPSSASRLRVGSISWGHSIHPSLRNNGIQLSLCSNGARSGKDRLHTRPTRAGVRRSLVQSLPTGVAAHRGCLRAFPVGAAHQDRRRFWTSLGRSYRVKLWPTLIFLQSGKEVARLVRPTETAPIVDALVQIASAAKTV